MKNSEMSLEDQLQRQTNINLQLRRQLEACRRNTVEYCAKFCEEHEVIYQRGGAYLLRAYDGPTFDGGRYRHEGEEFAKGLRGIIGK